MKNHLTRLPAALLMLLVLLAGCGGEAPEENAGREQVTIAFWSDQLTEQYGQYLRDAFPEVDFDFYVATNSTDFYRFKEERGDLPDILTVRRFALRDVSDWREELLDLSDTDLANTFHQSYLRSYTYSDGTVNWLPACAEVDSLILDRTVFEANDIPIPTDYQSFTDACAALRKAGLRPFLSNFDADFTCMELLQGLGIPHLTSQAGREWRQRYESGQTDTLSEEVWLPIFQRMEEFLACTGITAEDIDREHVAVLTAFQADEVAMMRGTGNEEAIRASVNGEHLLMPYFGDTEAENWYLTYPVFQIAASARAEESPERQALILRILSAMLNQEGQEHISSGKNMIPYNRGVELDLSEELDHMAPYIEDNRLYIRLASADMFSVSKQIVQGMIRGEYADARAAFDAFNAAMGQTSEKAPAAASIDTGYDYTFSPQGGSPAVSAVLNSTREEVGADLLIGPAASVSGSIAAGEYTAAELNFLTMGGTTAVFLTEMTGEQVWQYMERLLAAGGPTRYAASGFAMEVRQTEDGDCALEALTRDGKPLDREAAFHVAVVGTAALSQEELAAIGVMGLERMDTALSQVITGRLTGGTPLAEPTDYITLK